MEQKRKTYKLKSGDTLASIAKQMLVSEASIKSYHNIHAHPNDRISNELPNHLTEIFVSPSITLPYFNNDTPLVPVVKYSTGHNLPFKAVKDKVHYTVCYNIITGDKVENMSVELSVEDKEQDQEGNHLFEVNKISKTYINGEEPNSIADELADKVSALLYPIAVVVNKKGKWIDIYNYTSIKERFEKGKAAVLDEYTGEWAKKYIALCEQSLSSKDILKRSFENNWFLNSFFSELYVSYTVNLSFEKNIHFPLIPHIKSVDYSITQKINEYLNEFELIEIEQKGILIDERSIADFENEQNYPYYGVGNKNQPKTTGHFESKYYINPNTNTIDSLFLECSINLNTVKKVIIIISKKETEMDRENIELHKIKVDTVKKEMILQD